MDFAGSRDGECSPFESATSASVCCNHQKHPRCDEIMGNDDVRSLEQLVKARNMGIMQLSPKDDVEGEIIYFQHRLLSNAVARKQSTGLCTINFLITFVALWFCFMMLNCKVFLNLVFADKLILNIAKSLPQEIELARMSRWDAMHVNQYLCELREAKKQGRKERRHKEAQAVLAAATAAAAASSRISSFRKDACDETTHQEVSTCFLSELCFLFIAYNSSWSFTALITLQNMMKLNTTSGRSGSCSQPIPRAKETLQKGAVPRVSLEKHSDFAPSVVDFSKEHPRSCDICRRSETMLNPILVCCGCKVGLSFVLLFL